MFQPFESSRSESTQRTRDHSVPKPLSFVISSTARNPASAETKTLQDPSHPFGITTGCSRHPHAKQQKEICAAPRRFHRSRFFSQYRHGTAAEILSIGQNSQAGDQSYFRARNLPNAAFASQLPNRLDHVNSPTRS